MSFNWDLLTAHQRRVTEDVLRHESSRRDHLVVSLSGAHAYGFPSPDSDFDIKAIHVEPTAHLVGLGTPALHSTRMEIIDGVEIDYSSNELGPVLTGILGGNGNYIERVLGALTLQSSAAHEGLRPLVAASLSRRVHRHYRGFATSQLQAFEEAQAAGAKKVLYVLRTTLTGAHMLRTGEVVTDVTELLDEYDFDDARELIAVKQAGERTPLDAALRARWTERLGRAFATLDAANAASTLPEEPPNRDGVEAWLLDIRRARWEARR